MPIDPGALYDEHTDFLELGPRLIRGRGRPSSPFDTPDTAVVIGDGVVSGSESYTSGGGGPPPGITLPTSAPDEIYAFSHSTDIYTAPTQWNADSTKLITYVDKNHVGENYTFGVISGITDTSTAGATGGYPELVSSVGKQIVSARWLNDGRVTYQDNPGDRYISKGIDYDGSSLATILDPFDIDYDPPTGWVGFQSESYPVNSYADNRVLNVYQAQDADDFIYKFNVYTIDSDGASPSLFASDYQTLLQGAGFGSPDGTRLLGSKKTDTPPFESRIIDASDLSTIGATTDVWYFSGVRWSPGGTYILGFGFDGRLWYSNDDLSVNVQMDADIPSYGSYCWVNDDQFAFLRVVGSVNTIELYTISTATATVLATTYYPEYIFPVASGPPDDTTGGSEWIYFTTQDFSSYYGVPPVLWAVQEGDSPQMIVECETRGASGFLLSPNGYWIAYNEGEQADLPPGHGYGDYGLRIVGAGHRAYAYTPTNFFDSKKVVGNGAVSGSEDYVPPASWGSPIAAWSFGGGDTRLILDVDDNGAFVIFNDYDTGLSYDGSSHIHTYFGDYVNGITSDSLGGIMIEDYSVDSDVYFLDQNGGINNGPIGTAFQAGDYYSGLLNRRGANNWVISPFDGNMVNTERAWKVGVDGSLLNAITPPPLNDWEAAYPLERNGTVAPDGTWIVGGRTGFSGIYIWDDAGSAPISLVTGGDIACVPGPFAPDSSGLVCMMQDAGFDLRLVWVARDGTQTDLTTPASGLGIDQVAFGSASDRFYWTDGSGIGAIKEVPVDGSTITTVYTPPTGVSAPLTVSDTGTIAFLETDGANFFPTIIDTTGANYQQFALTSGITCDSVLISKSGNAIWWTEDDPGTVHDVYLALS